MAKSGFIDARLGQSVMAKQVRMTPANKRDFDIS